MKEARVNYFEIPCDAPEKTMDFFEKVFHWTFQRFGNQEYWFAKTGKEGPGINGAVSKRRHPNQPITNAISVGDIDEAITLIKKHGGQIKVPKTAIPSMGWLAFFNDPDGNIHGLWQADKSVK